MDNDIRPVAQKAQLAKSLTLITIGALAVLGAITFAATGISYATIARVILGAASGPGNVPRGADSLAGNFPKILMRLRFCAAGFMLTASLTAMCRRAFSRWIAEAEPLDEPPVTRPGAFTFTGAP